MIVDVVIISLFCDFVIFKLLVEEVKMYIEFKMMGEIFREVFDLILRKGGWIDKDIEFLINEEELFSM